MDFIINGYVRIKNEAMKREEDEYLLGVFCKPSTVSDMFMALSFHNTDHNPFRQVLLSPFYRWETEISETKLPVFTQV